MIRNIIKYVIILVVVIGIGLVIRNIVTRDNKSFKEDESKGTKPYYQVTVSLLDKDSSKYIEGATLVIKNEASEIIEKWKTTDKSYVVTMVPKGKYVLEQLEASDDYSLNENSIEFTISDKDLKLVMYNTSENSANDNDNTQQEIPVGDTLSINSPIEVILGTFIIIMGVMVICFRKKITE